MSKKGKNVKKVSKQNKVSQEKRDYKNPADSVWGKIIIWVILFGMVGTVIAGLIGLIIQLF